MSVLDLCLDLPILRQGMLSFKLSSKHLVIAVKIKQYWNPAARLNFGTVERETCKDPVASFWRSGEQAVSSALDQDLCTCWKRFSANGFNTGRR